MPDDLKSLQGTWTIAALEVEGGTIPSGGFAGATITVKGKRFTSSSMGAVYDGTVTVDERATPKTIDLAFATGPEAGTTGRGIYELAGDTWRLCLSLRATAPRPKVFATRSGSGHALEVLRRGTAAAKSPKKSAAAKAAAPPPADELSGTWAMVSCVRDGEALDARMVAAGRRVGAGDETTTSFGGQVFMRARYTIHRSATPLHLDYVLIDGPDAGKPMRGIYALAGKTLTICFGAPGQPRPTEFASKTGSGITLTTWKPAKS